ncbi:MAG: hypothetical protein Greene101415_799 [Parcubacteria group bacterium Greene1014_15]|nr:MAG: hypothetical protein Greene101415_799 [Parcubacteria group bacterium Greene1014_15]
MKNAMEIVEKFLDAENQRDWILCADCLDEKVQYQVIGSKGIIQGKEKYVEKMKETYTELSDWNFKILTIQGDDKTVVVEFAGKGHYSGIYEGIKYDNRILTRITIGKECYTRAIKV